MERLKLIEKEINKGISIDEKSNQVINNWSPNNVRRLIIGQDFAVIHYYITGGKYSKLIEIVDLRRVRDADIQMIEQEPEKYKSVLNALTDGRICSSIEEIVFCSEGYNRQLLQADTDLKALGGRNTNLDTRFVRLKSISVVNTSVKTMAQLADDSKKSLELLETKVKEQGIQSQKILEQNEDSWQTAVSLRGKYYQMDSTVLQNYFDKLKGKHREQNKFDKLSELNKEKHLEALSKATRAITLLMTYLDTSIEYGNSIYDNAPLISKAEWASVLSKTSIYKGLRQELNRRDKKAQAQQKTQQEDKTPTDSQIQSYRRIDFQAITSRALQLGISESDIEQITYLEDLVFNKVLQDENQYKRETNKYNLIDSVNTLKKLALMVYKAHSNIVYLSLAKFLTSNTPTYAQHFHNTLQVPLTGLRYTRITVEYCNTQIESGWTKQAFDDAGFIEVTEQELGVSDRNVAVRAILNSLATR